ncbi:hypothetical protein [Chelativorans salis]|uniref:Uncharacterized protein n=1 Tax=Chelativorans salis TaxID=2978478 RepID=A0ABT2LQP9_9HYPH|nr:hypothetical protein [Chelativorans sp. EGI FJ00035]MCT7376881.1 hypothetical protein [Chelativorans sp. EGI FJ00035]
MPAVQPFLIFQGGHPERAMNFHVSLFDGSEVLDVTRWRKGEQGGVQSWQLNH